MEDILIFGVLGLYVAGYLLTFSIFSFLNNDFDDRFFPLAGISFVWPVTWAILLWKRGRE